MSPVNLTKRVEMLEETVDGPNGVVGQVDRLRGDVSSLHMDFLQFKDETRVEFSAVRREVAELRQETRAEQQTLIAGRAAERRRVRDCAWSAIATTSS